MRERSGRILIALAAGRRSLARLRRDDRVAMVILDRQLAVTAHGRAQVVKEGLVEGVVAVEVEVDSVQDHNRPEFEISSGVAWRWRDEAAASRDSEVRAALERLAERCGQEGRLA